MSDWRLVHESSSEHGTTKIYQDSNGDVRVDSFNGNVRNPVDHDRFTLNTRNGGNVSGHDYDHQNSFDSSKGSDKTK